MEYRKGQRLEANYNGHVVKIERVDADGGVKVIDADGRTGITTTGILDRHYRPIRGEK